MLAAYKVRMTEYERGMGQRPDGTLYATDKNVLQQEIARQELLGDRECYVRAGSISVVEITEELLAKIKEYGVYGTIKHDDPGEVKTI